MCDIFACNQVWGGVVSENIFVHNLPVTCGGFWYDVLSYLWGNAGDF